jgi:DNA processing protein
MPNLMANHQAVLHQAALLDHLRLIRSDGVGPVTYKRLLARFGTAAEALAALPELAKRHKRTLVPCSIERAQQEIDSLYRAGGRMILRDDPAYPSLLAATDDAPPVISVLGRVELLQQPILSIVGARNATLNGRRFTEKMAAELGQHGYVIASGLARGIDTAAHHGSLAKGTIAVLAGGVDNIYPPENKELYMKISQEGVILSEMPWGITPTNQHFPRRNRLIAGLAQATILIEAAVKSGSLITTRLALEQGREVFAVPGSPLDPRHAGPNHLIKSGQAQLIDCTQDILDALSLMVNRKITTPPIQNDLFSLRDNNMLYDDFDLLNDDIHVNYQEEHGATVTQVAHSETTEDQSPMDIVLKLLGPSPISTDHLIQSSGLPVEQVLSTLLQLELSGQLQRQSGNMVALLAA